jgi:soluble lytic murein transglycosylase
MKKIIFTGIVTLFISTLIVISYADIYKYIDENGVTHYTNIPPDREYERIIVEPTKSGRDYEQIIKSKSKKYNIEPEMINAVITAESNWDSKAVSKKGAIGLMQLMPPTARDLQVKNPFDPEQNIEGGTKYLKQLLDRFNGNMQLALAAYNAGPSIVEKSKGMPSIAETKQFVRNVIYIYENASLEKPTKIYKVTLEDGTVLFTNVPPEHKQSTLSNFQEKI